MTLPWYLTTDGLYLCTVAAWFVYRYPLGAEPVPAADATTEAARALGRHRRCAHLGGLLLILGFFLQLLGLLFEGLAR